VRSSLALADAAAAETPPTMATIATPRRTALFQRQLII